VTAHDLQIARYGGLYGIRDRAAIEAAVARPYTGYYRSIERKAAALVESLACNHGFIDGNKRTALVMLQLLLIRSGYRLQGGGTLRQLNLEVEKMILDLVEHHMTFDQVVAWLEQRVVPVRAVR
jgi:death on curing protein